MASANKMHSNTTITGRLGLQGPVSHCLSLGCGLNSRRRETISQTFMHISISIIAAVLVHAKCDDT